METLARLIKPGPEAGAEDGNSPAHRAIRDLCPGRQFEHMRSAARRNIRIESDYPKAVTEKRKRMEVSAYKPLLDGIVAVLEESRRATGRAVNSILTATYWEIGRRIVMEEQLGRRKADYGDQLVEQLAADLTARFGKGFSRTNVF